MGHPAFSLQEASVRALRGVTRGSNCSLHKSHSERTSVKEAESVRLRERLSGPPVTGGEDAIHPSPSCHQHQDEIQAGAWQPGWLWWGETWNLGGAAVEARETGQNVHLCN